MKFKCLVAVTLFLIIITVLAKEYVKSLPVGRFDSQGTKLFRLCETDRSESYLELKDPLDDWSAQSIQDLSQCVYVKEQYWNQCQITNSTATVFKYGEKFYTFTPHGMWTSRHVEIHVDPLNEINCGDAISVCKIEYSPDWLCYELNDPLDPWTEAAIEDPINMVYVDDIYLDQCALLKPNVTIILEQRPAYTYHSEYYTLDEFAFYDDFSFKFKRLINPLITISWILLGLVWLGSGVRNFWNSLKKKEAKTKRLSQS